jgi:Flp pilus assembly protein TadD
VFALLNRTQLIGLAISVLLAALASPRGLPQSPIKTLPSPTDSQSAVDPRLQEARQLIARGDATRAEALLHPFLAEHPDSVDAHFLLGSALFQQIQQDAKAGTSVANSDKKAKAEASLAEFTEGAKHRKPSAADLKVIAFDYILLGSYVDADKWFTRMLDWTPDDAEGWYYLGRTKYNENRFAEAVQAFQRALTLNPRDVKAEDNLGLSYAGLGRAQDAKIIYETAIEWQAGSLTKDPGPYIDLADLFLNQGSDAVAIPYLHQAIDISPNTARAHELLGKAYTRLGRYDSARLELETAMRLAPENHNLPCMLAPVYRKLGFTDKTKAASNRCEMMNGGAGNRP